MSGLKSLISRNSRARSRTSAMRPVIAGCARLVASVSRTACKAGSEFSMINSRSAPKVITRSQISGADRAAAAGHHDRAALQEIFQPRIVDLHRRPQQQVFDIDRRQPRQLRRRRRATAAG